MTEKQPPKTKKHTTKKKQSKSPKKTNLKNIEREFDQLKDRHIRLKAEFENFRKRKNREISSLLQYDGEAIIKEILPIIDDIDRMVDSADKTTSDNEESIIEGINILRTKIDRFLENTNIEAFGQEGEALNPDIHDAMLIQKDDKKKDNVVLNVFEKGYRYHDKVVRHAKVIVNKK